MMNSPLTGSEHYNLLIEKRKRLWYTLFTTFQNASENSDDIAITDLPMPVHQIRRRPNTNNANTKSVTPNSNDGNMSDDDLDEVSDENNEDADDASENGSEGIARFSDSEEENAFLRGTHGGHVLVYETDNDEELSEDLDEANENDDEDGKDFIDEYLDEVRHSLIHCDNEDVASESDCSDDGTPMERLISNRSQRKRTFQESGLGDDSLEDKPPVKKLNCQLKNVNLYINVSESDFETDNE